MILNDFEINKLARTKKLIAPYASDNLRRASYDLTIGRDFCVFDDEDVGSFRSPIIQHSTLTTGQSFEVPPNAVCFIACAEKILLPNDLCARVSLRMSYIYRGMVVASQPPFDPGYHGIVVVMLHNLSNLPLPLKQGDRFVTIEFTQTTGPFLATTHASKNILNFNQPLNGRIVTSLQDLQTSFKRIDKDFKKLMSQLVGLVAVIIAIPTIWSFVLSSSLSGRVDDQQKEIDKLRGLLESQAIPPVKLTQPAAQLPAVIPAKKGPLK